MLKKAAASRSSMKIRTKVLVGFTLLFGIVLAQGLIEYRVAMSAKHDLSLFEFTSLRKTVLANDLQEAVTQLKLILALDTPPRPQGLSIDPPPSEFSVALNHARATTAAALLLTRRDAPSPNLPSQESEHRLLQEIELQLAVVTQHWQQLTAPTTTAAQRAQLVRDALQNLQREVKPRVQRFRNDSVSELLEHSHTIRARSERASLWFLGAAFIAFVIAVLARYWLVRTVMKPLEAVVAAADDITRGNLQRRMHATGNDEFALLAHSFNHMLDKLAATAAARDELRELADTRALELDTFFNVSVDALVIANHHGHFVRVNSAFSTLLGYPTEELLRRPFLDFVHPDDHELTRAESAKLLRGESSTDFANRHVCHDGTLRWLSWRIRPHPASGLLFAVGRDVTARKEIETALAQSQAALRQLNEDLEEVVANRTHKLRESEERFRRLVDGVKDYAIFMLDADGLIVSWNHGAERIKGYHSGEIIGGSCAKFYPAEDIAQGKPAHALAVATASGRYEETGWRLRNNGHPFLAHVVITAVRDETGILRGFANITRDITAQQKNIDDLKQQQELLRLLLENLAEGVVACDADGKITFFNKTARDWHGTDITQIPAAEWTGSFNLFEADGTTPLPPASIPLVRAARGERVRNAEMVIVLTGQPPRHVIASGDGLLDSSGNMIGAVVALHDITERRNAERHNLRTQRLESIGTLSGGIAHDLNNALAPILMGIELLKLRYPDSLSFLTTMETSAKRGASMVRQLLTFAKGVDGQRVALHAPVLVGEIEGIIKQTFPKNIELTVVLGEKLLPFLGDDTQMHQVLLNLCVNARDAMPDGGRLTIDVRNHVIDQLYASSVPDLKPGKHLRIQIKDTGTGIPPEIIERIFDPFFSTKPADRGTGLGLSTVIGILRSHAGCVQVYSTPGQGTSFSVYLPVVEKVSSVTVSPFAPKIDFAGQGRAILVVEDEPAVREIASAVLASLDFRVITADDGEAAMAQLAAEHRNLSLIITDLHMPRMDGVQFVKKARELLPELPIIVSSGRMEKTDAAALALLGVRTLLHKPFTQGDLVAALQHVFSVGSKTPFSKPAQLAGKFPLKITNAPDAVRFGINRSNHADTPPFGDGVAATWSAGISVVFLRIHSWLDVIVPAKKASKKGHFDCHPERSEGSISTIAPR
jgi:PAS domain S-box-containing protein